jgi:exopolysaccharide biosynthesis protein
MLSIIIIYIYIYIYIYTNNSVSYHHQRGKKEVKLCRIKNKKNKKTQKKNKRASMEGEVIDKCSKLFTFC